MFEYFKFSFITTVVGLTAAYFWGNYRVPGSGFMALFIVFVLAVLETSLSFDNAVINATKLEKMSKEWERRFLTWGIIIAVFGMRLLFPISIVSIFANLPFWETAKITLTDVDKYTYYLHQTHAPVLFFGAAFLLMLFFHYFFDEKKENHWIKWLEKPLSHLGHIQGIETALTLITIYIFQSMLPAESKLPVVLAAINGVVLYLLVHGLSEWMNSHQPKAENSAIKQSFKAGLVSFLYLELIDASFSLDGVLGAFALSKDIIIITLGLAIGAMFVRSFTIMLVEKKTLKQYVYLENGAHWAIGVLAFIMFYSTLQEVPEVVTGLAGLVLIVWSFISSMIENKKVKE
ncbi:MAG: DUF475 domain-containing protein [bacterium]|nr:DUF475 domain-containing protein [bacterium]